MENNKNSIDPFDLKYSDDPRDLKEHYLYFSCVDDLKYDFDDLCAEIENYPL